MNPPTNIICSRCGYATNEPVGEDGVTTKLGRCCDGLPAPYEYDSRAGTYSLARDRYSDDRGRGDRGDCDCPDCVCDALELSEEVYDEIQALYDDDNGTAEYRRRIAELGW